jgi:hypothetical protein
MSSEETEESPSWEDEDEDAESFFVEDGVEVERLEDLEPEEDMTSDALEATEEGIPYQASSDPSVLPSDNLEGLEVAAGFAPSMEETSPDRERLPDRIEKGDLELEEHVRTELRDNSETGHLTDVEVSVSRGVVLLRGTVEDEDDIEVVEDIVRDLDGVWDVQNELRVPD